MKRFFVAATLAAMTSISSAHADSLVTGIVNADGSKGTNGAYTVSHPSTGRYIITLTNYTGAPVCLFNEIFYGRIVGLSLSTKTCDVTFGTGKKGSPVNMLFTFHAQPIT